MPIGRPLSPGSVAGVRRRQKRRAVRAGAATPGPAVGPARRRAR